jgi:hypothetical protein
MLCQRDKMGPWWMLTLKPSLSSQKLDSAIRIPCSGMPRARDWWALNGWPLKTLRGRTGVSTDVEVVQLPVTDMTRHGANFNKNIFDGPSYFFRYKTDKYWIILGPF